MVTERPLSDDERNAMEMLGASMRKKLKLKKDASPEEIIEKIGAFIDSVRQKKRALPRDDDTRMGLGILWGEQIIARIGWEWVHVTYPEGFQSFGVVPEDRSCICFPINDIPEQMSKKKREENTSILLFNMIVAGNRPSGKKNGYVPFG